ncbi:MAG TPA: hypothetical protein VF055_07110 [Steroidobacteraceae bacterium]
MSHVRHPLLHPPALVGVVCIATGLACAAYGPRTSAQEPDNQPAAVATGSGPLETAIAVEILRVDSGPDDRATRRWVPAQRLNAGDELHYTVRVRNPGEAPVSDVVVTKRLPFGVRYHPGSATGPACKVQFSVDGGVTFAAPAPSRTAGTRKNARNASPTHEYTHVRWVLEKPLAPGATALLRFRAVFS